MSVIVDIHLETDLSEFTSTVTDSGDLYWAAAAALAGTAGGMASLIDDTTGIYGVKTITTSTTGKLRVRFYLDPNTLIMANTDEFYILRLFNSAYAVTCEVLLSYTTAAGYQIRATIINDVPATSTTNVYAITDASHYIEIYLQRAATDSSNDGSVQLWIDGISKETKGGIDNYHRDRKSVV